MGIKKVISDRRTMPPARPTVADMIEVKIVKSDNKTIIKNGIERPDESYYF
ncbi:MAG: hypothetical protein Fur0010_20760 [Bdellovibrio sp.]